MQTRKDGKGWKDSPGHVAFMEGGRWHKVTSYSCQWSSFHSTKEGIAFWQGPADWMLVLFIVQSSFLITTCRALTADKYSGMHRETWYFLVEYQLYPFLHTNPIIHSLSTKDFSYKSDLFDKPFSVLTYLRSWWSCSFLDNSFMWWFVDVCRRFTQVHS